jgi:hypothetical protein
MGKVPLYPAGLTPEMVTKFPVAKVLGGVMIVTVVPDSLALVIGIEVPIAPEYTLLKATRLGCVELPGTFRPKTT